MLVFKETTDPQWKDDPRYKDWLAWMQKCYPEGDLEDWANVLGYSQAQMLVQVLLCPKSSDSGSGSCRR